MQPTFDLEQLHSNTGGDRGLQREIIELFLGQIDDLVETLSLAGDQPAWFEAAHTIKGGARSIGAGRLAELAARAEALAPSDEYDPCGPVLADIRRAVADLRDEFPKLFSAC